MLNEIQTSTPTKVREVIVQITGEPNGLYALTNKGRIFFARCWYDRGFDEIRHDGWEEIEPIEF